MTAYTLTEAPDNIGDTPVPKHHDFNTGPEYSRCGRFYKVHPTDNWTPVPTVQPTAAQTVFVQPPNKTRFVYIMLALFLGGLGIHNFYAGRTGSAVAQLLISLLTGWLLFPLLIVGLWVLVEAVVVNTDGNGQRMV